MAAITLDPRTHCGCLHPWVYHIGVGAGWQCTAVIKAGYRAPQRQFCTCTLAPPVKEPTP